VGANPRTKGHGYEREICDKLRSVFPKAKRHLEFQVEEAEGYDLDNTGPYRIQCKRHKNYVPVNTIEEVKAKGIPVLITKADRKKDVVCMYLNDWINILSRLKELEDEEFGKFDKMAEKALLKALEEKDAQRDKEEKSK
jgi:hypothetical protein